MWFRCEHTWRHTWPYKLLQLLIPDLPQSIRSDIASEFMKAPVCCKGHCGTSKLSCLSIAVDKVLIHERHTTTRGSSSDPRGGHLVATFSVPGSSEIHSWTRGAILCLCVTDFRRDSLDRQETCIGSLSMDLHEMAKAHSTEHDLQIQFLLGPFVQNLLQTWSATVSSGRTLGIMVTWHCVPGMQPSPHAPTVPGSRIGDPGIFGGRDEE